MSTEFLAVEIGGTKLQLAVGDGSGKIFERQRLAVEPARGAAGIRKQIEQSLPSLLAARSVAAAAVGFGGPVDRRRGSIARSHQIEGWSGFGLAGWLQALARVPVLLENDANAAALGEALHGAGRGFNPVFYVTLGSGVGGGLVVDGSIYHGAPPVEAEIGHLRLDRAGTTLESRCSGWAADRRIRALQRTQPASALAAMLGPGTGSEAKHLAAALAKGDAAASGILAELAQDLAYGLSHVVHLLGPELIIIGGGLSGVGEPLRAAVSKALPEFLMEILRPGPRIVLSGLGEDAVPVGALALAARSAER